MAVTSDVTRNSTAERGAAGRGATAGPDRGSVTVEVAILVPAFLVLVILAAVVGRSSIAQNAVDLAAHDAARAASIARNLTDARAGGQAAATQRLAAQGLDCAYLQIELAAIDIDGRRNITLDEAFASPIGQRISITAQVICDISVEDLFAVPSEIRTESWFVSSLDRFRPRDTT